MARNGSGTYTVPNTLVAGTTITASDHNENYSDIGTEITNSVAVDGQSTMSGQFKAANGTVAAPGITFGSDLDTGFYRIGADNPGLAAGGVKVMGATSSGVDFPLALTKNSVAVEAFASGTAMLFVQTSAPTGWTKVTSTNNAALRLVSGTASSGGTADFTTAFTSRTIAQANLPNVNFTVTGTATGTISLARIGSGTVSSNFTNYPGTSSGTVDNTSNHSLSSGSISGTAASGGSGTALDFAVKYVDVIHATKD